MLQAARAAVPSQKKEALLIQLSMPFTGRPMALRGSQAGELVHLILQAGRYESVRLGTLALPYKQSIAEHRCSSTSSKLWYMSVPRLNEIKQKGPRIRERQLRCLLSERKANVTQCYVHQINHRDHDRNNDATSISARL